MGCRSEVIPGHKMLTDTDSHPFNYARFVDLLRNGKLKNIFIIGDIESFSNEHALFSEDIDNSLLNVIVLSPSISDKEQDIANYIIPTTLHSEEIGTYTNLERKIQLSDNIVKNNKDVPTIWGLFWKHLGTVLSVFGREELQLGTILA